MKRTTLKMDSREAAGKEERAKDTGSDDAVEKEKTKCSLPSPKADVTTAEESKVLDKSAKKQTSEHNQTNSTKDKQGDAAASDPEVNICAITEVVGMYREDKSNSEADNKDAEGKEDGGSDVPKEESEKKKRSASSSDPVTSDEEKKTASPGEKIANKTPADSQEENIAADDGENKICAISEVVGLYSEDRMDTSEVKDKAAVPKDGDTDVCEEEEILNDSPTVEKSEVATETQKQTSESNLTNGAKEDQDNATSDAGVKICEIKEVVGMYNEDNLDSSEADRDDERAKDGDPVKEQNLESSAETTIPAAEGKKTSADHQTQGRVCTECKVVKKTCKYQVLLPDRTTYLCDETCFKAFRARQTPTTTITSTPENRPRTRSVTSPKDYCNLCRKEVRNGMGFLPGVGENKPLCSEECMRKYQTAHAPKRACSQCGNAIQGRNKCLTWETMEFCNEDCLGKYQTYLGSHCAHCNNAVQRTSLGKYCVRFGSDIKQFCSNNCLEEFKKGLKVCSFCSKDISSGTEGFLAPVGDKGQFKDFCSHQCMEKFEVMNDKNQPVIHECSVCNKVAPIKVQVMFNNKSHKLCSEPCIAAFRYANKINTSICDSCHKFFDIDVSQPNVIQFEGLSKRFCSKTCMNIFVLSHRKIVPCTWCKVKKYNFDMIERVDSTNSVQLFCSLNCLSLFRVSLNATSSRSIRCDQCCQLQPAQFHLTMSDASIRNFCSYDCVMDFQSGFANIAPVTPSQPIQAPATNTTTESSQACSTPVISSVVSLAPSQKQATSQVVTKASASTSTTPVLSTPATNTTSTESTATHGMQQVIIKPPPPKQLKNKALMCKPLMQTKGVSCKPHPCHKGTQTTEEMKPTLIPIPVPVPIYVPVPMHMYVSPAPIPFPIPLPVPVPVFIPTTKNSADSILKHIKEIREKLPADPFEAELLMMAEMVAAKHSANNTAPGIEQNGKPDEGRQSDQGDNSNLSDDQNHNSNDVDSRGEQSSVETELQDSLHATNAFSDDMLRMALRMATEMDEPAMDLEAALVPGASSNQQDIDLNTGDSSDLVSPRQLRARARNQKRSSKTSSGRGRGRKKARIDESAPQTPPVLVTDGNMVLKYTYGVNAWKHWVLQKNSQLEKASQTKLKLFKTDILQLTADELNYSLCLFVKEVRKPNGDEYAPDSIFYLCLGIQQYLFESGRIDNIFTDIYYEKYTECLNEVLQKYDMPLAGDACQMSRIEEEILWESKQLGAHSPHVLLNTLMYFNTKHFMLKTVEEHMRLSFSHVMKHWKKPGGSSVRGATVMTGIGRNVLLRYCPPPVQRKSGVTRKRKDDHQVYEQIENADNPLRCPVKLYEFYLSKCPESIRSRSDVFYLFPERSCVPDSPVWYSMMPLGREAISKMLQRIKMVREVSDIMTFS